MSLEELEIPAVLGNYYLELRLGAGFSGAIYRAKHIHSNKVVAIKIQHADDECPTNRYERGFYPSLQGGKGMPELWSSGQQGKIDYLVMDLLGPSLDNLYRKNGKKPFDLRSTCCIAIQMIERLQFMHSRGILHRDIQLGNAVIGLPPNENVIYMIDFGFSKRYIDPHTSRHIQDNRKPRDFIGNYWFSSVNVHCKGRIPTRRDDIEAAALMFIHMMTPGGLPWTRNGVPREDDEHERLRKAKKEARPEDLCRGMPAEFEEFLRHCRKLRFADSPDYDYWKEEFRMLMSERGWGESDNFIWPPPPEPPAYSAAAPPPYHTFAPAERKTITPLAEDNVEKVLHDLAALKLGARPILGDRTRDANTPPAQNAAKKPSKLPVPTKTMPTPSRSQESVPATSMNSDATQARDKVPVDGKRMPKAVQLRVIESSIGSAIDNLALAHAVQEFGRVLRETASRNLTREGFAVLDALYKQLADPSVFAAPLRRRQTRAAGSQDTAARQPRYAKADQLSNLKREIEIAASNTELATTVHAFGALTDQSNGRTITKDGYAILDSLAARLKALA